MNIEELLFKVKGMAFLQLKIFKDLKNRINSKTYNLNIKINELNKALKIIENKKELKKTENVLFVVKKIIPMFNILDINVTEINFSKDSKNTVLVNNILYLIKFYTDEITELNKFNLSEKIKITKDVITGIEENNFYKDFNKKQNLITFIMEHEFEEDETNFLINYINDLSDKYEEELKLKQSKKINTTTIVTDIKKEVLTVDEIKDDETPSLLTDDELNLISVANKKISELFVDKNNLMDENKIESLNEILNYSNEELCSMKLFNNLDEVINNKKLLLLNKIRIILNKFSQLLKDYENHNLKLEDIYEDKEKCLLELQELLILYDECISTNKSLENNVSDKKKHLIYFVNSNGNIPFINDLKKKEEYYLVFEKMLYDLQHSSDKIDTAKNYSMTNHNKLNGIFKFKHFSSRIVYIPYKDCCIVLICYIKKNSNGKYENELVKNFYLKNKSLIDEIIKKIDDPISKSKLLDENNEIHEDVLHILNNNYRGTKKKTF